MTEAIDFQAKRMLVLGVGVQLDNINATLLDIAKHYYRKVMIDGTRDTIVSDDVKKIVRKADFHGLEIIDATPAGSTFKTCARWELRLINTPTVGEVTLKRPCYSL